MTTTVKKPFRASRYTTGAIVLHWAIALLIMANIALGFVMVADPDATDIFSRTAYQIQQALDLDVFATYQLHKSLGISVLILTLARIAWRLFNPPPPEPASVSGVEKRVSHLVHIAFYAVMLAMPLTGWLMVTVASQQIETKLFFAEWLPWPNLPFLGELSSNAKHALEDWSVDVHAWIAYGTVVLLGLHIAGALKHQLQDGAFIGRMWPTKRGDGPRRAFGQATATVVAVLFAAVMIGSATYARQDNGEVVAAVAAPSSALPATESSASPAPRTEAQAWTPRIADSRLGFVANFSGNDAPGTFAQWTADIRFDPDNLDGSSIAVTIDMASATIASADISDNQLRGSDGFNVREHNAARFSASTIRASDDGSFYIADGELALRGVTQSLTLPFTVDIDGEVATASAEVSLNRQDFGIGGGAGDMLADDVAVTIDIVADRGGPAALPPQETAVAPQWSLVPAESNLAFTFGFEGTDVTGAFAIFDAEIRFDPNNLAGSSITATVDLGSASVTGRQVSNSQVRGSDGLAANQNPAAVFTAESITSAENGYRAEGTLTLRGKTVPVPLSFDVTIEGDRAVASGTTTLQRFDFDVGVNNDATGDTLSKEVVVSMDLVASRSSGETASTR